MSAMAVASYSGPSTLNDFLHSWSHCTFEHGCRYLPFTSDTDRMVEPHEDAPQWLESVLLFGFVPFTAVFLYLLVDSLYRCLRHCCWRKHVNGCCACCCARDVDDSDEAFVTNSRITFGSRTYGSAAVASFPSAEVALPTTPGHNPRRGGVAGQAADMFSSPSFLALDRDRSSSAAPVDPTNPFHQSSRLLAVSHDQVDQEVAVTRISSNPDRNYDARMLVAVVLSLAGLILLGVSIAMSQVYSAKWTEVQNNVVGIHDYFETELQQEGLGALTASADNFHMELTLLAGVATLPDQYKNKAQVLAGLYVNQFAPQLAPFNGQLQNQTRHFQDAKQWMHDAEYTRTTVVYTLVGVTMAFSLLVLIAHVYYRQRPCLSLTVRSLFGLLLIGTLLIFAFSLSAAVGVSDVCQSPIQYADSLLNSSLLTDANEKSLDSEAVEIIHFYVDCPQLNGTTSALLNPLFLKYFIDIPLALKSSAFDGALADLQTYLATRSDLQSYEVALANLNTTLWLSVAELGLALECEPVHNSLVDSLEVTCHPLVRALWTQSVLVFFGVLVLLVVRCLVWMRVRKTNEFDDDEAIDADVNPRSSQPFGATGRFDSSPRPGTFGSANQTVGGVYLAM